MKKQLLTITLAAILTGCATNNVANEQQLIINAAALATAADLQSRATDLPYFLAAEAELDAIANSTNTVNVATIEAALQSNGKPNTLQALGLTLVLNTADTYIASSGNTNVQEVASWIATGIGETAGPVLAASEKKASAKFKK